ncbi:hypothetical protein CSA56_06270 [candidate division KSB3 bacterium]|uniref:Sulfotransferase domain-containing protein n=1 Tax=candidate division KSB3 bacterium TaxID=2044937 RepID=A0A2G6KJB9_9BACT|nr:MAG: hypothetical protein CSA56_06270 [candidate division KSB3 bacterium]
MEKEALLVVGYPKSGNTWLTRLVAELIECPVQGFFDEPENPEMAIEGQERISDYVVFKGHQPFHFIQGRIKHRNIIYVVRDVRDVAVSGAYYFNFPSTSEKTRDFFHFSLIKRFVDKRKKMLEKQAKIWGMIQVLDKGSNTMTRWCRVPWDIHVNEYVDQNILIVRYEDLLANPVIQCKRILAHLNLERTDKKINEAIHMQSFTIAKNRFLAQGDHKRAYFLRQGKSGGWEKHLTRKQKNFLKKRFYNMLKFLKYTD